MSRVVVKQAFGLLPFVKNSISFCEDHQLVYVTGHQVCVLNTDSKDQNFITLGNHNSKSLGVSAIACSQIRKFIAVAEKTDHLGIVTIYDSHTFRKKKTLNQS